MERKLDLSIVKDLCAKKNISVKDFCAQINVTEAGFYRAVKTGKTTSDILERIANYFDCKMDIFFTKGQESVKIEGVDEEDVAFVLKNMKYFLKGAILLYKVIGVFARTLTCYVEKYYAEKLTIVPGHYEESLLDKLFNRWGKWVEENKRKPTRDEFVRFWLYGIERETGGFSDYEETLDMIRNVWKFQKDDYITLQKLGILNPKDCLLLILLTNAKYDMNDFLDSYERYKADEELRNLIKDIAK